MRLAGIDALLQEAGIDKLPTIRRVVPVGNKISPGNPVKKPDGTIVKTLWGELAWQLGGKCTGLERALICLYKLLITSNLRI